MRRNKWKKAGMIALSAAFVGSFTVTSASAGFPAFAAVKDVAVTEYDAATLEKFKDNTLEYWEIPGLIERYNTDYQNQLQKYYYNPGGSTGLTKDQMLELAADLRNESDEMERDANDAKDEGASSREAYKEYKANMHALRAYAQQLEDAANGKGAGGASALRGLRITRNEKTKTAREAMRKYETLKDQYEIALLNQEIAKQNYEAAQKKKDLGMFSAEDVLSVEDALNSANGTVLQAGSSLQSQKQTLITMLGWDYSGNPDIKDVPEPDLSVIASFDPKKDEAKAIEMNYTLYDTRMAKSSSSGGAVQKARNIKDQEDQVRTSLDLMYQDVKQKQKAYEASETLYEAAKADKAAADRKNALGMMSRQEYLQAESAWLSSEASHTSSSSSGGAVQKARNIKDQEDQVRTSLDLMYQDVKQKQKAYEASETLYEAAKADKAAADRKNALGMMSRQEYLQAESAWLSSEASHTSAKLDLTGAIEDYQWALEGLLDIGSSSQG